MPTPALRLLAAGALLAVAVGSSRTEGPSLKVAGLGDCEKVSKDGPVPPSPHFWDPRTATLRLQGARNEVVAAQLMLTAGGGDVKDVDVEVGDLRGPGLIDAGRHLALFREIYQFVENGDWSWGPPSRVLPSRQFYPEVLVPFTDPWRDGRRIGAPFDVTTANGPNQGVFFDLYIPRDASPGRYTAPVRVRAGRSLVATATLELTVLEIRLPDETHVDAYGELYGHAYRMHGVPYGRNAEAWWRVAARYHQLAHAHRMVVCERAGEGPEFGFGSDYDRFYGPVLDGTLFSTGRGYVGPGSDIGVAVWRAPVAQAYDGYAPDFENADLEEYSLLAAAFRKHAAAKGWTKTRFFAYVVDEAPTDARTRENERRLQKALDAGAGPAGLPLLWVSHVNPATLAPDASRDRRGLTRWWVPNGGACDPAFLKPRIAAGETVWFYHHGHPSVGVHGVNATGVELRTWGTICWRYGLHGTFVWAVDFGDPERPLERPIYKKGETRWGNGVLVYPGARLPDIGLPPVDGPLPSLRLKAYRRGLQDYEYAWLLAEAGKRDLADAIVRRVIPVALTEAKITGVPPWSTDVNDWYRMREELAAALTFRAAADPGERPQRGRRFAPSAAPGE